MNLQVVRGEMIAIMGESGSGKTTLLHELTGIDAPDSGDVIIGGKKLTQLTGEEKAFFRRKHIGMIFQDFQLLESLSVKENVLLPLILDHKDTEVQQEAFTKVADALGIRNLADKGLTEISGGQKQRVAIGRALIHEPEIIFGDEPTGNLDSATTIEVIGLLKTSCRKYNQTILMVTHNEAIAQICDRIIHIEDGMVTSGTHLFPQKEGAGNKDGDGVC